MKARCSGSAFGCDASLTHGQPALRFGGEIAQVLSAIAVGYAILVAGGESAEHLALVCLEKKLLYLFADMMIDHGVPLDFGERPVSGTGATFGRHASALRMNLR